MRKIENSEINEEIHEVNYPLSLKVAKYKDEAELQNEIRQQKLIITKEGYIEGADDILPVWFQ